MIDPEIAEALWPVDVLQFRPGATTKDKTRAMALAYVDPRLYQERLDELDPNWTSELEITPLDGVPGRVWVKCTLTVGGVSRQNGGETLLSNHKGEPEENALTSAIAQAFKRTCTDFGIGRYLYAFPQFWADYDAQRKRFTKQGEAQLRDRAAKFLAGKINAKTGEVTDDEDDPNNHSDDLDPGPEPAGSNGNGKDAPKPDSQERVTPTDFWKKANDMMSAGTIDRERADEILGNSAGRDGGIDWPIALKRLLALEGAST